MPMPAANVTPQPQNRVWWGLLSVLGCAIVAVGAFILVVPRHEQAGEFVSPLSPEAVLGAQQLKETRVERTSDHFPANAYFPKSLTPRLADLPDITAQAYAIMDRDSGELLVAHNILGELPIASVTKIMTATVALERFPLTAEVQIASEAASIGEATMGLSAGEIVTIEDLLYGLMLPSGNDAAETIAGGLMPRAVFLSHMNQKAHDLGMYDTFFFNPSGLDEHSRKGSNFSTCLDLLALTNYALNNEEFAKIVASHDHEIPYLEGKHKYFHLYNILLLDFAYPGIKGVKPGVTEFAGETLVSYGTRGGKNLIVVLLGAQNTKDEVIKLYNYVYPKIGVKI